MRLGAMVFATALSVFSAVAHAGDASQLLVDIGNAARKANYHSITSYNVCYTKLLRKFRCVVMLHYRRCFV